MRIKKLYIHFTVISYPKYQTQVVVDRLHPTQSNIQCNPTKDPILRYKGPPRRIKPTS